MSSAARAIPTFDSSGSWDEMRTYVPENYRSLGRIRVKTAAFDLDVERVPVQSTLPLFALNSGGAVYRLVRPIAVKTYRDGEWVFAENEALNLIGTGSTLQEAINDLQLHVVHFWNYYSRIPDESLTADARQLKRIYSDRFIQS